MLKMNQAEMDQIVNDHFKYEFTDNVDGVVSTLTEDVVHEIVGGPLGRYKEKPPPGGFMSSSSRILKVKPLRP
jgi:hypothetical protein